MARVRMVTRTVVGTECDVMCVNTMTAQIEYKTLMLGTFTDDEKTCIKLLKKEYEDEYTKIVKVERMDKLEKCYGMLETEFLKYAHELDLKTRKMLELEDEDTSDTIDDIDVPFEEPKKAPKKKK